MRGTVLVVDDQELPRRALVSELEDAGFAVVQAADGHEAWAIFCQSEPDAVVTDMVMPAQDGLDLLAQIRTRSDVPVILFTAYGTVQAATAAFKSGADDFVSSTDAGIEELVRIVEHAVSGGGASPVRQALSERFAGASRTMVRVRERIAALAPLRTPVFVVGEPGTGRRSAVTAIHELGSTAGGELRRIDAHAIGMASGTPRVAAIHLHGVEHFSDQAQAYWADVVERSVADEDYAGPRVLASAGDPLTLRAGGGGASELRSALLRFALEMPPLRSIASDIPAIADSMMRRIGRQVGRQVRLSPAARTFIASQRWHGNARQLERVLERTIAFSRGRQVRRDVVKEVLAELEESVASIREQHAALERDTVIRVLQETGGNVSRTAEFLGKSRAAVYRMIEKHAIPLARRS